MEQMETLGVRLKRLRAESGMTQEQLAGRLLVTRQAIAKWENDNGTPDLDNLLRLSDVFGISMDVLVGRNTENQDAQVETPRSAIPVQPTAEQPTPDEWSRAKAWPHWHLIASVAFLISWVIWLICSVVIYDSVGATISWALALFCAVINLGTGVIQLVLYIRKRNA